MSREQLDLLQFRSHLERTTYVIYSVYKRIVAAVAHRQPVAYEPDDVDVPIRVRL